MKKLLLWGVCTLSSYLHAEIIPQSGGKKHDIYNAIVIGSGPAGMAAAMYLGRGGLDPLVLAGEEGGMLMNAGPLENWPGEPGTLGPNMMKRFRDHAMLYGAQFVQEFAVQLNLQERPFCIKTSAGRDLKCHTVIIATGSLPKKLHCPGEELYWGGGKGVVLCTLCDGPKYVNKPIIIYGSGDSAMARALFMVQYTRNITLVFRGSELEGSAYLRKKVKEQGCIHLLPHVTVDEILGDGTKVTGVKVHHVITQEKKAIPTDAFFLSIGLDPCNELLKGQVELTEGGFVKVYEYTKTSVEGVFVAGNIASHGYKPALAAAGTGCMAGVDAEDYLVELLGKERMMGQEQECWKSISHQHLW